jgi:hypothetical protein
VAKVSGNKVTRRTGQKPTVYKTVVPNDYIKKVEVIDEINKTMSTWINSYRIEQLKDALKTEKIFVPLLGEFFNYVSGNIANEPLEKIIDFFKKTVLERLETIFEKIIELRRNIVELSVESSRGILEADFRTQSELLSDKILNKFQHFLNELKKIDRNAKSVSEIIEDVHGQMERLKKDFEKTTSNYQQILRSAWEETNIEVNNLAEANDLSQKLDDNRKKIAALRTEIENIIQRYNQEKQLKDATISEYDKLSSQYHNLFSDISQWEKIFEQVDIEPYFLLNEEKPSCYTNLGLLERQYHVSFPDLKFDYCDKLLEALSDRKNDIANLINVLNEVEDRKQSEPDQKNNLEEIVLMLLCSATSERSFLGRTAWRLVSIVNESEEKSLFGVFNSEDDNRSKADKLESALSHLMENDLVVKNVKYSKNFYLPCNNGRKKVLEIQGNFSKDFIAGIREITKRIDSEQYGKYRTR